MNRSSKKTALYFVTTLLVFPFFSNCSEPMKPFDSMGLSSVGGSLSLEGKASAVNERAILSAEQVLKSMESVTGVPIDSGITDEFRRQQDVLSGSYDLNKVNPPMLNGITNLAGAFCTRLLQREIAQTDMATRKFFTAINFSTLPANLQAADYTSTVQSLARAFWGRDATTEELDNLNKARVDHIAGKDTRPVTANTQSLFVLVCTGMLASFDSYTF